MLILVYLSLPSLLDEIAEINIPTLGLKINLRVALEAQLYKTYFVQDTWKQEECASNLVFSFIYHALVPIFHYV